jgi:hypothetical protein
MPSANDAEISDADIVDYYQLHNAYINTHHRTAIPLYYISVKKEKTDKKSEGKKQVISGHTPIYEDAVKALKYAHASINLIKGVPFDLEKLSSYETLEKYKDIRDVSNKFQLNGIKKFRKENPKTVRDVLKPFAQSFERVSEFVEQMQTSDDPVVAGAIIIQDLAAERARAHAKLKLLQDGKDLKDENACNYVSL